MAKGIKDYMAEAKGMIQEIDVAEAKELVADPGVVFLDVREPPELANTGHIPGAVHVPRGLLEFQADPEAPTHKAELDPSKKIVINCASGGRSALAAKTLTEMGYTDVVNLIGGMTAWLEAGGPTEK
ncbi:MAG: rhodanese-like domain-containing protein [Alphaproteobacteria bacterium]